MICALVACDQHDGPSEEYRGLCAQEDPDGSFDNEKYFLRAWMDETYLWYSEVPRLRLLDYVTAIDYFTDLKTTAVTASGQPRDRFHYTIPTDQYAAYTRDGVSPFFGYGITFAMIRVVPPRLVMVAEVEPGSPAALAGLSRGATIVRIDGEDVLDSSNVAVFNAALAPKTDQETHWLWVVDAGETASRPVSLTPQRVLTQPVKRVAVLDTPTGPVGYLAFDEHLAVAERPLIDAIAALKAAAITDLVVDLRYNRGGSSAIASELAFMIAGQKQTTNRAFQQVVFNDKRQSENFSQPFLWQTVHADPIELLPSLNLPRVYVLTTADTCSASEALINGLRGIDLEVIQIGERTCGKPYGMYPIDNCRTTYFAINVRATNDRGFGDYEDGLFPGCEVEDDLAHERGDPREAQLAAALEHRVSGRCQTQSRQRPFRDADADWPMPRRSTLAN